MKCVVLFVHSFILCVLVSEAHTNSSVDNLHYVGCFDPGYSLRQNYHHHMYEITLGKCVDYCITLKARFAGVEASDSFCYCGGDIAEESIRRNDSLCNVPCPSDTERTCGGDWLISVYDIKAQSAAVDVAADVDFLIGISVGVRLYHLKDMETFDTLISTNDWAYSVDYHLKKNLGFVVSKKKIYKMNLDPKRTATVLNYTSLGNVGRCEGFAVDWVHDRLYWGNCDEGSTTSAIIKSMNLFGGNVTTLLNNSDLSNSYIKRMEIDPYIGMLFWTAEGVIESCDISGDNFQTNMSIPEAVVRALTLDLRDQRVYYVGVLNTSTSFFSMDYEGNHHTTHFTIPEMRSVYGLGLLGGYVYWVNYAVSRDVLYKAPLNLSSSSDVKMIMIIDRAVWHMRVVHPDMQKRPNTDPCRNKGCDYKCVILGFNSARCQCPVGQELSDDEVSCYLPDALPSHRSSTSSGSHVLLLTFILVVLVLMTSAALVYLADKYWAHLRDKLQVIPYSRTLSRKRDNEVNCDTAYNINDDNVDLIPDCDRVNIM